jgi:WD40 repeat protein
MESNISEIQNSKETIVNTKFTSYKITERKDIKFINDNDSKDNLVPSKFECFSIRFSKNDVFIGSGLSNGRIHLFNKSSLKQEMKIIASDYAITSIRFKGDHSLMSVSADGRISTWHCLSGKKLHSIDEKSPIMCMDINSDHSQFATGGNDKIVRLYDDETKTLIRELTPTYSEVGHSNRIFAVCFSKDNPNLLASGGWDSIVVFYDIREKKIIGNALGAHICGDALDIKGNLCLTGSWRTKDQIKIFDIRNYSCVESVNWEYSNDEKTSYVYTAQFSKKTSAFAVGGSQENLLRIWDYKESDRSKYSGSDHLPGSVYSVDFSNCSSNCLAVGSGDSTIRLYDMRI